MIKSERLSLRVSEKSKEGFLRKCKILDVSMTKLLEMIVNNEVMIFDSEKMQKIRYLLEEADITKEFIEFDEENKQVTHQGNIRLIYHKGNISSFNNAENYTINFFEKFGWKVYKSNKRFKKELRQDELIKSFSNTIKKITDNENKIGRPDLIAFKDKRVIFIEVKTGNDGLRGDQIKWAINHPHYEIIVFYVNNWRNNEEPQNNCEG